MLVIDIYINIVIYGTIYLDEKSIYFSHFAQSDSILKIVLSYINQILRNGILQFQNGNISSSVYKLYLGCFPYFHSRNEEKPINMVQSLYKMQTLVYILVSYHKFRCIYRKNMNFNYIIFKLRTPNHETNEIQSLFISCFNRRIYINQ